MNKLKALRQLLQTQSLDPDEKRRSRLLNTLILGFSVGAVLAILMTVLSSIFHGGDPQEQITATYLVALSTLVGMAVTFTINRYWSNLLAGTFFLLLLIAGIALGDLPRYVVQGRTSFMFVLPILIASVLLRPYASFFVAGIVGLLLTVIAARAQLLLDPFTLLAFSLVALVSWLSSRGLERVLADLRTLNRELDERVAQRTTALQASNDQLQREIAERKRVDEALRVKDHAIASSLNAVGISDLAGNLTYVNESWLRMNGYDDEREVVGKPATRVFSSAEDTSTAIATVGETGAWQGELVGKRKDGSLFDVYLTASIVTDEAGEPICIMGSGIDITERKRAAARLRESEQRYRSFVQNFHGIAYQGDLEFRPLFFHGAVETITGYSEDEFVAGKPRWDQVIHPDDRAGILRDALALRSTPGYSAVHEYRILRKDGQMRWIRETVQTICDDSGEPVLAQGALYDITERKHAEDALQHSLGETARGHRMLQALSQAAQAVQRARTPEDVYRAVGDELTGLGYRAVICVLVDDRARLAIAHLTFEPALLRAAERLTGVSAQGYSFPLVPGGFHESIIDGGEATLIERATGLYREAMPKLGHSLIDRLMALLKGERGIVAPLAIGGEPAGLLAVIGSNLVEADVPAISAFASQAAIAIENARLYEQARRDAETKSVLLREVNHRTRNNLSGIIGLLYTERDRMPAKDRHVSQSVVESMMRQVRAMAAVHNLLASSEWAAPRLSQIADHVLRSTFGTLPGNRQASIRVTPSSVRVTPAQARDLALIINELATNTIKHVLGERGAACISANVSLADDEVRLEYRDDGAGYPEEVRRAEQYNVGLSLLREIVCDTLHGELVLHNDEGAVTTIRFPVAA